MTVPAVRVSGQATPPSDTLPFQATRQMDPSTLLREARAAGLRGKAFELLAMAAAVLPREEFLPLSYFAEAAGISPEAAGRVIGQLVPHWVRAKRTQQIRDGKKRDLMLYAVVAR